MAREAAAWAPLSEEQLQQRRIVNINAENVTNTAATDIPLHYGPGQDDSWNLELFKRNFRVEFHQNKPFDAAFSIVGVDASIANAFRRILISEIPTVAIEQVFIYDNTSIIQDEVLAHRLGLIPLMGNREGLRWLNWFKKAPPKDDFSAQSAWEAEGAEDEPQAAPTDYDTIVMTLDVTCRWAVASSDGRDGKKLAREGSTNPKEKYVNSSVYAHQLVYKEGGENQQRYFSGDNTVRPVNPNILIAKLRPGQRIQLEVHCIKGVGQDHAKFSPVATASYRLLPDIKITQPIVGESAKAFAKCFPKGVIGFEDDPESGEKKAVVVDPMKDTVSRECLRYDEFKDKVKLGRIRDHFIFSVESTGQFESDELFIDSVRLLKTKAETFKKQVKNLRVKKAKD